MFGFFFGAICLVALFATLRHRHGFSPYGWGMGMREAASGCAGCSNVSTRALDRRKC